MSPQRQVFEQSVEGIFLKGHAANLTPALKNALKAAGLDLDQKLKPSYPPQITNEATRLLRVHAYGHEPDDSKAYFAIGVATLDGYLNTFMGKAMAAVLRLIGFKKAIDRLPQSMASGSNYQTAKVRYLSANVAEVVVGHAEPHPAMNLGVFHRAFTHYFKAPDFKVELVEHTPPGATYRLSWK